MKSRWRGHGISLMRRSSEAAQSVLTSCRLQQAFSLDYILDRVNQLRKQKIMACGVRQQSPVDKAVHVHNFTDLCLMGGGGGRAYLLWHPYFSLLRQCPSLTLAYHVVLKYRKKVLILKMSLTKSR